MSEGMRASTYGRVRQIAGGGGDGRTRKMSGGESWEEGDDERWRAMGGRDKWEGVSVSGGYHSWDIFDAIR